MENENVSFRSLNSLVDNFANEYYQRHGHLPMFYIVERFLNPNRSLENDKKLFLMTAIRKTALYMLDS